MGWYKLIDQLKTLLQQHEKEKRTDEKVKHKIASRTYT